MHETALAGVSEGCCWAMHDLKMDYDSTVGVDGTSLFVYHGGELLPAVIGAEPYG